LAQRLIPPPARSGSRVACLGIYLAALTAAGLVLARLKGAEPLLLLGLADLAGTLAVFAGSLAANNSSIYDPCWSLTPVLMALYWTARAEPGAAGPKQLLIIALVALWGGQLTWNWLRRWRGVADEDWRYREFRASWGRAYWPLSLIGIHLVPTAIVFLAALPLWPALTRSGGGFGTMDLVALAVTLAGIALEAIADRQLHLFLRADPPAGALLDRGLWGWSRHPNYLGELLFWWGLWLFGVAAAPDLRWLIVAPLTMTALFLAISIPLKERRMAARRPGFADYRRRVPRLLPWPV